MAEKTRPPPPPDAPSRESKQTSGGGAVEGASVQVGSAFRAGGKLALASSARPNSYPRSASSASLKGLLGEADPPLPSEILGGPGVLVGWRRPAPRSGPSKARGACVSDPRPGGRSGPASLLTHYLF